MVLRELSDRLWPQFSVKYLNNWINSWTLNLFSTTIKSNSLFFTNFAQRVLFLNKTDLSVLRRVIKKCDWIGPMRSNGMVVKSVGNERTAFNGQEYQRTNGISVFDTDLWL